MNWFLQKLGIVGFWLSWLVMYVWLRRGLRSRVLVIHNDEILLVQNWHGDGKWSVPGGGVHKHESTQAGAARELYEETGITVSPTRLEWLFEGRQKSHGLQYRYACFGIKLEKLQPKARPPEIIKAAWVPIKSLTKRNTSNSTLQFIARWQQRV